MAMDLPLYLYSHRNAHFHSTPLYHLAVYLKTTLISTVFTRSLIQSFETEGYVRGFSSSNSDWRRINMSQNVRADANTRPDFMPDVENRNLNNMSRNVNADANARPDFGQDLLNRNSRNWNNMNQNMNADANAHPDFMQNRENINSRIGNHLGQNVNANTDVPDFMQDKEIRSKNDAGTDWNSRPMDFVRGIIDEDNLMRGATYQYHYEQDADFVHIKLLRNNTFVTVTDNKGNIKLSGSAGSLKDLKSGQKLPSYAEEATAEVFGRRARGLGLKSVVMKVNGFTRFRRKRQAIMSWREGFTAESRGDRSPIVYIEDTTRKPHNGCRLPKKRRI